MVLGSVGPWVATEAGLVRRRPEVNGIPSEQVRRWDTAPPSCCAVHPAQCRPGHGTGPHETVDVMVKGDRAG